MRPFFTLCFAVLLTTVCYAAPHAKLAFFEADNPLIQYTGRIDFTNPKRPRFSTSGVYIQAGFKGTTCDVIVNDEVLYGKNHNYIAVVIDGQAPIRLQLKGKSDTIRVAHNLKKGKHTILVCKNTETGIGHLEFVGFRCQELLPLPAQPTRRIEFIGNSITCGTGTDQSEIKCETGQWYDQHNAYMAYGPRTARTLNAQWHLTSVSGIGLIHSCCNMDFTMPEVFDKIGLRKNQSNWDFSRYVPDVVTICLGQNDGFQDSTTFCRAYVSFIGTLRSHYPNAQLVCLTSPMADAKLTAVQKNYLSGICRYVKQQGDTKVSPYFFTRSWNSGCGGHPDLTEHEYIATELTSFLKQLMHW